MDSVVVHPLTRPLPTQTRRLLDPVANGSSLVEAMVALAIIMAGMLSTLSAFVMATRQISPSLFHAQLMQIKQNAQALLASDQAWSATANDNGGSAFSCLGTTSDCSGSKDFRLLAPDGTVVIDSLDSSKGFRLDGSACSNFVAEASATDCPIRVVTSWSPVCSGASCIGNAIGQLRLDFRVQNSASLPAAFNRTRYDFTIYRDLPTPVGPPPPPPPPPPPAVGVNGEFYLPRIAASDDQNTIFVGVNEIAAGQDHVVVYYLDSNLNILRKVILHSEPEACRFRVWVAALGNNRFIATWAGAPACSEAEWHYQVLDQLGNRIGPVGVRPALDTDHFYHLPSGTAANATTFALAAVMARMGGTGPMDTLLVRYVRASDGALVGEDSIPLNITSSRLLGIQRLSGWPLAVIVSDNATWTRAYRPPSMGGLTFKNLVTMGVDGGWDYRSTSAGQDGSRLYLVNITNGTVSGFDGNANHIFTKAMRNVDPRIWPNVIPTFRAAYPARTMIMSEIRAYLFEPVVGRRFVTLTSTGSTNGSFVSTPNWTLPGNPDFIALEKGIYAVSAGGAALRMEFALLAYEDDALLDD